MFPAVSPQLGVMGKPSNFPCWKHGVFLFCGQIPEFRKSQTRGRQPLDLRWPTWDVCLWALLVGPVAGLGAACFRRFIKFVEGATFLYFFAACVLLGIGADFCRQPLGIEPFSYGLDPGDFCWVSRAQWEMHHFGNPFMGNSLWEFNRKFADWTTAEFDDQSEWKDGKVVIVHN